MEANIKSLLTFIVGDVRYRVLREWNSFSFFTDDGKLVILASSVIKKLAPFMAELLDFKLILSSRAREPEIPPPAYAFLPLYIDQDDQDRGSRPDSLAPGLSLARRQCRRKTVSQTVF